MSFFARVQIGMDTCARILDGVKVRWSRREVPSSSARGHSVLAPLNPTLPLLCELFFLFPFFPANDKHCQILTPAPCAYTPPGRFPLPSSTLFIPRSVASFPHGRICRRRKAGGPTGRPVNAGRAFKPSALLSVCVRWCCVLLRYPWRLHTSRRVGLRH